MYRIKTLNKIASVGLRQLDAKRFEVGDEVANEDGILVRSAKMHDYEFPASLRAIARAGAGTNNIPIDRCTENGIVVFNTPGANANAVKELVLAAMLLSSRDILGGAEWVQEQAHTPNVDLPAAVEKGKSAFVGPELYRKTLGVVGLGAIGALVAPSFCIPVLCGVSDRIDGHTHGNAYRTYRKKRSAYCGTVTCRSSGASFERRCDRPILYRLLR